MEPQPAPDLHGLDPRDLFRRGLAPGGSADWTPPGVEELAALFPGYEVEELLGRGGMGAVYRARQPSLDRLVAIKVLPLEISAEEALAVRFRREARALARLQHPHIIAVHDFGTTAEGHLFFVMEYVNGTDLAQLLRGGRMDILQTLDVVRQICEALQFAHVQGVVHRDIKPANVLVDRNGRVKVGDFGLAKLTGMDDSGDRAIPDPSMGTPEYTAPEQWRGQADHRADIYSLGVMFYEMLTGEVPHGSFEPPSRKAPIDARLDPVVLRAMQEEPERRYQQAFELRADVDRVRSSAKAKDWNLLPGKGRWFVAGSVMMIASVALFSWQSKLNPISAHRNAISPPPSSPVSRWTNSLGMPFVPLGTEGAKICVWETRVRDFEQFATQTGLDTPWGLYTLLNGEWIRVPSELTWRSPGFEQSPDHPVCGVDWNMARDFCQWLTERERSQERLPKSEAYYRLPTDTEWTLACAPLNHPNSIASLANRFPWGTSFPPPPGAGNLAGEEVRTIPWPADFPRLSGYRDEFRATAPVGSFGENALGIADLAGNLWEWCEDGPDGETEQRWLRGGSWVDGGRKSLGDGARTRAIRQTRTAAFGFRVVLVPR
jgi:serine/threonine protein kinase